MMLTLNQQMVQKQRIFINNLITLSLLRVGNFSTAWLPTLWIKMANPKFEHSQSKF